jgi:hypothetical protein
MLCSASATPIPTKYRVIDPASATQTPRATSPTAASARLRVTIARDDASPEPITVILSLARSRALYMFSSNATPTTITAIPHARTAANTHFGPGFRKSASKYCRRAGGVILLTSLNCAVSHLRHASTLAPRTRYIAPTLISPIHRLCSGAATAAQTIRIQRCQGIRKPRAAQRQLLRWQ